MRRLLGASVAACCVLGQIIKMLDGNAIMARRTRSGMHPPLFVSGRDMFAYNSHQVLYQSNTAIPIPIPILTVLEAIR